MSAEETDDPTAAPTPAQLRRIADAASFERGEDYFADGAVHSILRRDDGVEARVDGTRTYRVRLRHGGDGLDFDCTCPVGQDGLFCKHCVAVGLAWSKGEAAAAPPAGDAAVRGYLMGLDKDALVSLLLARAEEDEALERQLTLQAALANGATVDAAAWKEALANAVAADHYIDYREAAGYADEIGEVVDTLDALLRQGQAAGVIALAEHAVAALEDCREAIDDSDGEIGGLVRRLEDIHLTACETARPDPAELAARLFELETGSDYDAFHGAVASYADVLGESGIAVYRRLAEAEWAKVAPLGPGERESSAYAERFQITAIMEAIARIDGDLEALVAVRSRDLSLPYGFLRIAELYRDAGDAARALDWAERGWQAFPGDSQDSRLRALLAELYRDAGRDGAALALVWEAFEETPDIAVYRQLETFARHAGKWPEWRGWALELVRERIAKQRAAPPGNGLGYWGRHPLQDNSLLVEIFLHEGDVEAAWREALAGGCAPRLRLALAGRRAQTHPADAIGVYRDHLAGLLRNTGDAVYRETVEYLEKIEPLCARLDDASTFDAILAGLRAEHRRKRKLMAMLDRKGW